MSIPLNAQSGTILLLVFVAIIFGSNWKNIQSYKTKTGRIKYSGIILLEILLLIASRFVSPFILRGLLGNFVLYFWLDLGVFFVMLYLIFKLGDYLQRFIKE